MGRRCWLARFHRRSVVKAPTCGHANPATAYPQINRLIQAFATVLNQHVFTGDAKIGGTVLNVGGHIAGADQNHLKVRSIRRHDELARIQVRLGNLDACGREKRRSVIEDSALG